jgi:hypothetical protein
MSVCHILKTRQPPRASPRDKAIWVGCIRDVPTPMASNTKGSFPKAFALLGLAHFGASPTRLAPKTSYPPLHFGLTGLEAPGLLPSQIRSCWLSPRGFTIHGARQPMGTATPGAHADIPPPPSFRPTGLAIPEALTTKDFPQHAFSLGPKPCACYSKGYASGFAILCLDNLGFPRQLVCHCWAQTSLGFPQHNVHHHQVCPTGPRPPMGLGYLWGLHPFVKKQGIFPPRLLQTGVVTPGDLQLGLCPEFLLPALIASGVLPLQVSYPMHPLGLQHQGLQHHWEWPWWAWPPKELRHLRHQPTGKHWLFSLLSLHSELAFLHS